jgi:hypothetical protein
LVRSDERRDERRFVIARVGVDDKGRWHRRELPAPSLRLRCRAARGGERTGFAIHPLSIGFTYKSATVPARTHGMCSVSPRPVHTPRRPRRVPSSVPVDARQGYRMGEKYV